MQVAVADRARLRRRKRLGVVEHRMDLVGHPQEPVELGEPLADARHPHLHVGAPRHVLGQAPTDRVEDVARVQHAKPAAELRCEVGA